MSYFKTYILAIFFILGSQFIYAASPEGQKMVIVRGDESRLMKGDPYIHSHNKPRNYKNDRVLPFFLEMGWRIRSVHVNEKSKEDNLYGYVIIEK